MYKIADVIEIIERNFPPILAAEYDNPGIKIGNEQNPLTGILVTLDTNVDVVKEAIRLNCNLIIEHHPSIWSPLRAFDISVPLHNVLIECAKNDITLYSAHTNVDFAEGGLNDFVAEQLGLMDVEKSNIHSARIGKVKETNLAEYSQYVADFFQDDNVITIGDLNKKITRVAVINGAGGNEVDTWDTYRAGADVFVTSEVKYNVGRLAKDLGYAIIQVGHYESEALFMPLIKKVIENELSDVTVHTAKSIGSIYNRRG